MVKSPKIYIRDSGVLHYLLDIPNFEALESNPILGASWEGYVIEQIFQQVDEDTRLFFYRTHEGAECDLVLVKGDRVLCAIEIKYTSSPKVSKGMRNAFDDIKAADNYIVTPNTDHYYIEKDIQVINLKKFLSDNLCMT